MFFFPIQLGISSSQLTKSYFFREVVFFTIFPQQTYQLGVGSNQPPQRRVTRLPLWGTRAMDYSPLFEARKSAAFVFCGCRDCRLLNDMVWVWEMDYISYNFWMISKFSIFMCVQELSSTEWLYFHTVTRISYYTSNHLSSSCKGFPPVFSRLFKGGSRVKGNQLHKYHYRWVTFFFRFTT